MGGTNLNPAGNNSQNSDELLASTQAAVSQGSSAPAPLLSIRKSAIENDLILKVEPVVESLGYSLRDLEVLGSGASAIIRVTLDKPKTAALEKTVEAPATDPEQGAISDGIGIQDCSQVHQLLNPMFDVWDPLPHTYALEVASPGERPNLRTWAHFNEALGEKIQFQTTEAVIMPAPMKPRRNWEGQLKELRPETAEIIVVDGYGEHLVHIEKIKAATWLREWVVSSPKKPHKNTKARSKT